MEFLFISGHYGAWDATLKYQIEVTKLPFQAILAGFGLYEGYFSHEAFLVFLGLANIKENNYMQVNFISIIFYLLSMMKKFK